MKHLLTRKEAEAATGKSRATLARYVKEGKLSVADKNDQGHNLYDPSELQRVFGNLNMPEAPETVSEPPESAALRHHNEAVMQAEISLLKQQLSDRDERIDDLKKERDQWRHQAQNLLTHEVSQVNKPSGLFRWFRR